MRVASISNFQIDTQCPQCGAPVVLDETDHIMGCDFCRTRHILHTHPFPCYYMAPRQDRYADLEPIYVPYWRFKGLEFRLEAKKPGFRVIDQSTLALKNTPFPASLGLRSQTQKLQFVQKDVTGTFMPPVLSHNEILKQISGIQVKKIHIGEILSLIYMPFYRKEKTVIDGISGTIIPAATNPEPETTKNAPAIQLRFTPGHCPNCGWDLAGETDSLVLNCHNCHTNWLSHSGTLKKLKSHTDKADAGLKLPFWSLEIMLKNLQCTRYSHLIEMANLPMAVQESHKQQPLIFNIPAFKINPRLFLRVGKQTTLARIETSPMKSMPKEQFHPADLPLEEGFQAILPLIMELAAKKKETWEKLKKDKLELRSFSLTYLSFRKSGSEYIQDAMGISIPVNALRFGRGI